MPTMRSDVQTEKSRKYHKIIKKIEKQKQEKFKKKTFLVKPQENFILISIYFNLISFTFYLYFILIICYISQHILVLFLRRQHWNSLKIVLSDKSKVKFPFKHKTTSNKRFLRYFHPNRITESDLTFFFSSFYITTYNWFSWNIANIYLSCRK